MLEEVRNHAGATIALADRHTAGRPWSHAVLHLKPDDIRSAILGPVLHYAAGNELFGEGEDAADVFKVVTGLVRTCNFLSDGRRLVDAFHASGDVFGFEAGAVYRQSAEAACDCTVIPYRRNKLDSLAALDGDLAVLLFSHALRTAAKAQGHSLLLGRRSALGKISAFLVQQAAGSSDRMMIDLAMTRQDIADYLGLTIETVSRAFTHLERDALIELITSRRIRLKNLARLCRIEG